MITAAGWSKGTPPRCGRPRASQTLDVAALAVALWGFRRGQQVHGSPGPLVLAAAGAVALVAGVVFIHGFPAWQVTWSGSAGPRRRDGVKAEPASSVQNLAALVACDARGRHSRTHSAMCHAHL